MPPDWLDWGSRCWQFIRFGSPMTYLVDSSGFKAKNIQIAHAYRLPIHILCNSGQRVYFLAAVEIFISVRCLRNNRLDRSMVSEWHG
jgi:hypothetical protein